MLTWHIRIAVAAVLILMASPCSADPIVKRASFENEHGVHEIRMRISRVTTDVYGPDSVRCDYSVFRNAKFLHPECLGGGTVIGGDRPAPEDIVIHQVGTSGWMFGVGGICGNTFSFAWTIVIPGKRNYAVSTFLSKQAPVLRVTPKRIEIWSYYQEWGRGGTAVSFFVPELRHVPLNTPDPGIERAQLPKNLSNWPRLEYWSGIGVFVAGIAQLNPEIMESVLERDDTDFELFRYHGLPTTNPELRTLIEQVRQAKKLKERHGQFWLNWTPREFLHG